MTIRDRIALLLWRDIDGYDPATGSVGNDRNISLFTRCRQAKRWLVAGWIANWKWWVTTIIATCAVAATIVPLYLNLSKPAEQVDADAWKLALRCVEQGKCIIRIEPVRGRDNQVITGGQGNRLNDGGAQEIKK